MVYANAIARKEIGCEPDLWSIFLDSPKAWFYLLFGPYCPTQYRFRGPSANPDMAERVFKSAPVLVYPLEFMLQQAMELLLGFLSRFWSTILGWIIGQDNMQSFAFLRKMVLPFVDLNN